MCQALAAGICCDYLSLEFAVAICRGFFVHVSKSFLYVRKSHLYGRKLFLSVSRTFLFVRFSLLITFLFVIAVPVMGHRTLGFSNLFTFNQDFGQLQQIRKGINVKTGSS